MKVLVVAGTHAGVGKTTFSVGLMGALRQRGLVVQAFKVGPDLLDPLLHEAATGRPSYNLDGWLQSRERNIARVASISEQDDVDVSIIEGGETLFDADDANMGECGSTSEIAKWLGAPVILVIDCASQSARGAAATVRGHVTFDDELAISGVVLNKVENEAHEIKVREAIHNATPGVPVLGALKRDDAAAALGPSETANGNVDVFDAFAAAGAKASAALQAGGGDSIGGALVGIGSFSGNTRGNTERRDEEKNNHVDTKSYPTSTSNRSESPRAGKFVAGVAAQLAHVVGQGVDLTKVLGVAWPFVAEPASFEDKESHDIGDDEKTKTIDEDTVSGSSNRVDASTRQHQSNTSNEAHTDRPRRDSTGGEPKNPRGEREKEKEHPTTPLSPRRSGQQTLGTPKKSPSKRGSIRGALEMVGNVASHVGPALRLGRGVEQLLPRPLFSGHGVRIGIARDVGFCHYFRENLLSLEHAGAELVPFSPVAGDAIPQNCKGLMFGGGYPELHTGELTNNRSLRAAVTAFAASGGVVYAECGGLTFLSQSLSDLGGGKPRAMCGLAPFSTRVAVRGGSQANNGSKQQHGYVTVAINEGCPLFPEGSCLKGYVRRRSAIVSEPNLNHKSNANGVASNSSQNSGWFAAYDVARAGEEEPMEESEDECTHSKTNGVVKEIVRKIETGDARDSQKLTNNDLTGLGVVEGYAWRNVLVSYVRLHWGDQPEVAAHFVDACRQVPNAASDAAVKAAAAAHAAPSPVPAGYSSAPSLPELATFDKYATRNVNGSSDSLTSLEKHSMERNHVASPTRHKPGSLSNASSHADLTVITHEAKTNGFVSRGSSGTLSSMSGSNGAGVATVSQVAQNVGGQNQGVGLNNKQQVANYHRRAQSEDIDFNENSNYFGDRRTGDSNNSKATTFQSIKNPNTNTNPSMHKSHSTNTLLMRKSASSVSFGSVSQSGVSQSGSPANAHLELEAFLSFPPASGSQVGLSMFGHGRNPSGVFNSSDVYGDDGNGNQGAHLHTPAATPQPIPDNKCQIACLSPAATEIVHALGLQNRLACVTDRCDYPLTVQRAFPIVLRSRERAGGREERARRLGGRRESISTAMYNAEKAGVDGRAFGNTKRNTHRTASAAQVSVDVEWLRRSRPGLVLAQDACARCVGGHGDGVVARALSAAGLLSDDARGGTEGSGDDDRSDGRGKTNCPVGVLALDPQRLGEVLETIQQVGQVTGEGEAATALVGQLRERLRSASAAVASAQRKPRVLSLEGLRPFAVGGHWLPEMKLLAGGSDELQEPGAPAVALRWEQVLSYAPEVLVLAPCVSGSPEETLSELERLAALPGWWAIPAVRDREVYVAHHVFFSRAGPRLVVGVEILAKMLHPSLARDVAMPDGHGAFKMKMDPNKRCRPRQLAKFFLPWGGAGEDGWAFANEAAS